MYIAFISFRIKSNISTELSPKPGLCSTLISNDLLLLGMECVLNHQYLQMLLGHKLNQIISNIKLKLNKWSYFHPLLGVYLMVDGGGSNE